MKLEEALYLAFSKLNTIVPSNTKNIVLEDVILALTLDETKLPELLGYSASGDGGFKAFRKKLIPNKPIKDRSYIKYLLHEVEHRRCIVCNHIKHENYFYKDKSDIYGLCVRCISCELARDRNKELQKCSSKLHYINNKDYYKARNALARERLKQATPRWADIEYIRKIYLECPSGYHVDHIIPLKGELVCGLHVENNLQYLTAEDNLKKSNTYNI